MQTESTLSDLLAPLHAESSAVPLNELQAYVAAQSTVARVRALWLSMTVGVAVVAAGVTLLMLNVNRYPIRNLEASGTNRELIAPKVEARSTNSAASDEKLRGALGANRVGIVALPVNAGPRETDVKHRSTDGPTFRTSARTIFTHVKGNASEDTKIGEASTNGPVTKGPVSRGLITNGPISNGPISNGSISNGPIANAAFKAEDNFDSSEHREQSSEPVLNSNGKKDSIVSQAETRRDVAAAAIASHPIITSHGAAEDEAHWRVLASLQGGIVIGNLNTLGGGFEVALGHDWQYLAVRYTSTFGLRNNANELFRNLDRMGLQNTQDISDYALVVGATIQQGNFWATIAAGPNYMKSSFESNFTPLAGSQPSGPYSSPYSTSSSLRGLGMTAQAEFGYRLSDYSGIQLTGFASNHTETDGGILLSIVVGLLR